MASGYGLAGGMPMTFHTFNLYSSHKLLEIRILIRSPGPSRCFPFWQELLACYVVNTDSNDMSGGKKCLPALEDYYECLHHRKEVSARHILNIHQRDKKQSLWR